jgi:hypothetical protein
VDLSIIIIYHHQSSAIIIIIENYPLKLIFSFLAASGEREARARNEVRQRQS